MSLGIPEIILILVVVLLVFGGKRIPELARSLGKAQHEYKKAKEALKEEAADLQKTVEEVGEAEAKSEVKAEDK
ncbi:twin-arginine translocase TatA/TatE family subunit [Fibrobacter sp. UWEL]|uniref:twin-arginine translocase TatA/TatE family subunit n=1 Tax=Fibrobacter sp. UWEL TaxID=1896209 RepID=UPI00091B88FB|nr:twin-arginine translocase TatA/TatE family subunit [Fibrobacter sp. UWEL]SHL23334.1 sec-independent protein translocase protein TatA [Fibrobacter sp. UWEL]